jgi:hypothetical protein
MIHSRWPLPAAARKVPTHESEGHSGRSRDYRGNDLPRRVFDEYAQRGADHDRGQQAGVDQLECPSGRLGRRAPSSRATR